MIWELAVAVVGAAAVGWGFAPLWRPAPAERWTDSRVALMEAQVLDDDVTLPVSQEEMRAGVDFEGRAYLVVRKGDRLYRAYADGATLVPIGSASRGLSQ